jgi:hypothetical protein
LLWLLVLGWLWRGGAERAGSGDGA